MQLRIAKIPLNRLVKHLLLGLLPLASTAAFAQDEAHAQWSLVDNYCLGCHNDKDWAGQLALSLMGPDSLHSEPAVFEAVLRKPALLSTVTRTSAIESSPSVRTESSNAACRKLSKDEAIGR